MSKENKDSFKPKIEQPLLVELTLQEAKKDAIFLRYAIGVLSIFLLIGLIILICNIL